MIYIRMICNKPFLYIIVLTLIFGCRKDNVNNPIDKEGWNLTFNDEFSDNALNTNVWKTSLWWGQSAYTNDQQLFIDSAFFLEDGVLRIEGKRQTVEGMVYDENFTPVLKQFEYTAGLIHSADAFAQQYGYFEIRCKVPNGKGLAVAFWMMPYDIWPPEIDVFEIKGSEPDRLHMTNHFRNSDGVHRQKTTTMNSVNFSTDFHVFAIEWNAKEIIWYMDNVKVFKSETAIPQEKMWMIISFGIGGNVPGPADDTTPSPTYFEIDYVRVYREK